jgi:ribosomal protein L11 methyltransferase
VPPTPPPGTHARHRAFDGIGTGHHASTRLCSALQLLPLEGQRVLDIGTGSGVLAIAAALDGAAEVLALDNDPDALQAARDNVAGNAVGARVRCERADLSTARLPVADVVVANLTGAILTAGLDRLIECVAPGGVLVLSGFTTEERIARRDGPLAGSPAIDLIERLDEEGWGCLVLRRRGGRGQTPGSDPSSFFTAPRRTPST